MRIKLTIAYDGTFYSGFAKNENVPTIENEINKALSTLNKCEMQIIGASRTDKGVHAIGNVAVFDTVVNIPSDKYKKALNAILPYDIRIVDSVEVPYDFHPRYTDLKKTYEYTIDNSDIQMPHNRLYSSHIYGYLDIKSMKAAAKILVGEHDFTSFCGNKGNAVKDKIRTIYSIDIIRDNNFIKIKVCGNGFLYNMVRIIAGTLIEVGMGRYPYSYVKEILLAKNRSRAAATAPANGLCLLKIEYLKS